MVNKDTDLEKKKNPQTKKKKIQVLKKQKGEIRNIYGIIIIEKTKK